jgi:hypothetical protein
MIFTETRICVDKVEAGVADTSAKGLKKASHRSHIVRASAERSRKKPAATVGETLIDSGQRPHIVSLPKARGPVAQAAR